MKFFYRAFIGLFILCSVVILLSIAGLTVKSAFDKRAEKSGRSKFSKERTYSAYTDKFELIDYIPKIIAFGEVKSVRSLELRTAVSGRLISLAEEFIDGGNVLKGSLLFSIDPSEALEVLEVSEVNFEAANAELNEAKSALYLLESDLKAAESQRELRSSSVKRQKSLAKTGITTASAVETAELNLSNSEQVVLSRQNALAKGTARIDSANIALKRSKILLDQAKRQFENNKYYAPFDGIISSVQVVSGRLLNKNEQLGILIDPNALEVVFQVSNREFSRLLDTRGDIINLPIRAKLELEDKSIIISGKIERSAAEISNGSSGRKVFASLDIVGRNILRPGDFLTVEIEEDVLREVSLIPASAINSDGSILLVKSDKRLEESKLRVLRGQGNKIVVADAPVNGEYIVERSAQLSAGIKVNPISKTSDSFSNVESVEEKEIELEPERLKKLISAVENNPWIPKDVKKGILEKLNMEKVPLKLVMRLEKQSAGK